MDAPQYADFRAARGDVPAPRQRRGRRYPWPTRLTLVAAALASGEQGRPAIAQWVAEHAEELRPLVDLPPGRVPSAATLRRTVRAVDVAALAERGARFVADLPAPPAPRGPSAAAPPAAAPPAPTWVGPAIDGKAVRGANRHGAQVHRVRLVRHDDGRVLGQVAVAATGNEITAAPRLLARRALTGTVTTTDALLTQHALAQQIRARGGHYLMVVKKNQPDLHAAIDCLFTAPLLPEAADCAELATTCAKGPGRLALRTLERSAALNGDLAWPAVGQVLRRTCQRVDLATGEIGEETTSGVTSLRPAAAAAAAVEALWRGHWTIENRGHRGRDATLGEDAGQGRVGRTPQALAALRNGLLSLLRALGWSQIADAVRHYRADARRAIRLLSTAPSRR